MRQPGGTPGPGARRRRGAHGRDARRAARVTGPGLPPPVLAASLLSGLPPGLVSQRDRDLFLARGPGASGDGGNVLPAVLLQQHGAVRGLARGGHQVAHER